MRLCTAPGKAPIGVGQRKAMPAAMTTKGEVACRHLEWSLIYRVQARAGRLQSELNDQQLVFQPWLMFFFYRQIVCADQLRPLLPKRARPQGPNSVRIDLLECPGWRVAQNGRARESDGAVPLRNQKTGCWVSLRSGRGAVVAE